MGGVSPALNLDMKPFFLFLDRSLSRLYRLSGYVAALALVGIAVLVLTSIVSRLLSVYVPGVTEYSGYSMAASSFLALAYTFEEKGHIRVELVLSRLTETRRWFAEIWCLCVASVVSVFLAGYLIRLVYFSWKFEEHSEGSDAILLWKPQMFVMIGAIILAICVVHHLIRCLFNRDYETR